VGTNAYAGELGVVLTLPMGHFLLRSGQLYLDEQLYDPRAQVAAPTKARQVQTGCKTRRFLGVQSSFRRENPYRD
jgi:hypothetical protein